MPRIKSEEELPDSRNILDTFPKDLVPTIGYKNIVIPLLIPSAIKGKGIPTIGKVSVSCDMTQDMKGSLINQHRSAIEGLKDSERTIPAFVNNILDHIENKFGARNGQVVVEYTLLQKKISPVSSFESWVESNASYTGKLINGNKRFYTSVTGYYTSLCPRSKEISDYGAHSQLSSATITVEHESDETIHNVLFDLIDKAGSSKIYNIISDLDESYITEEMYEHPVYVEDVVRKLAIDLVSNLGNIVKDYLIEANHYESIHTSVATASINAGKELK